MKGHCIEHETFLQLQLSIFLSSPELFSRLFDDKAVSYLEIVALNPKSNIGQPVYTHRETPEVSLLSNTSMNIFMVRIHSREIFTKYT